MLKNHSTVHYDAVFFLFFFFWGGGGGGQSLRALFAEDCIFLHIQKNMQL